MRRPPSVLRRLRAACLAWAALLLLGLTAAPPVHAQEAAPPPDSLRPASPFVRVFGSVRMETLRFVGEVPGVHVQFFGDLGDTLRYTADNLPRPLRPDTTYRDVRVYFELSTAFEALDRLLHDALRGAAARPDSLRRR